jgi:predicted nuclease of predicted toxin-antitoxin system
MRLKLDENLGRAAADLFRQARHEVETVGSEGLSGSPDEDIIAACQREQRGLVTLDLDGWRQCA